MTKKSCILWLCLFCLTATPVLSSASAAISMVDVNAQEVNISVEGNVLRVWGGNGLQLQIFNVTGVRVLSLTVDGQDKQYDLNLSRGCYIIKVGKLVRKISIR